MCHKDDTKIKNPGLVRMFYDKIIHNYMGGLCFKHVSWNQPN
jgi:hypothetical protein